MSLNFFRCEVCGDQLMFSEPRNEGKFPVTRRFEDQLHKQGLISVRCAHCAELPYRIEEGQPYRSDLIGRSDTTLVTGSNSVYNYWPNAVGHLLEIFVSSPSDEELSQLKTAQIEIGFLTEDEVNLIVVAYRVLPHRWNVTPFLWHAYRKTARGVPSADPISDDERVFTIAFVDDKGGKYRAIRRTILPLEFASVFHSAIHEQIDRGVPQPQEYGSRVDRLYELLMGDRVDSLLKAKTTITKND